MRNVWRCAKKAMNDRSLLYPTLRAEIAAPSARDESASNDWRGIVQRWQR